MAGWIKDYRKEVDSAIWLMPPMYHRVWQYLKYAVNHRKNKIPMADGTELLIKPGQHLTSIRNIAKGVGYWEGRTWKEPNPRTIMKIIKFMEKQNMISVERGRGNRQYTLVTIENWGVYQSNDNDGVTDDTTDSKQSVHINKNDKNDKNNIIVLTPLENEILKTLSTVENYPMNREKDLDMIKRLEKRYPTLNLVEAIKDWATYKLDKPLKKKDNPRSQINTSCKNYVKWGKNLKTNKDFTKKGANDNPYGHLPVYR